MSQGDEGALAKEGGGLAVIKGCPAPRTAPATVREQTPRRHTPATELQSKKPPQGGLDNKYIYAAP